MPPGSTSRRLTGSPLPRPSRIQPSQSRGRSRIRSLASHLSEWSHLSARSLLECWAPSDWRAGYCVSKSVQGHLTQTLAWRRVAESLHSVALACFKPQFENARIRRTLADKMRIMAAMSQLPAGESNKQRKNTLVRSETWLSSAEFLEFALRDELKDMILLV